MLYHPDGLYVWDTWYFVHNEELHCIHLQICRPEGTHLAIESGALGHAVTKDLIHWHTLPSALYPAKGNAIDSAELWTGCVQHHKGCYYLFYTARKKEENGSINRIALALSTDGVHFERYADNPVIEPDQRWYCSEKEPIKIKGHGYPIVDCRDLCIADDGHGGYWGFYAARQPAQTLAESSVIALAHSDDLIHWEQYPPAFAPDRYGCIEVPDVFSLDGRWYMLCLTGNQYGQRSGLSDPLLREATIYAVADKPEGPYRMMEDDNVLLGSVFHQGYSARTVEWNGSRLLFYTQGEQKAGCHHGCISLPQLLQARENGSLRCTWYPPLAEHYHVPLPYAFIDTSNGKWGSMGTLEQDDTCAAWTCATDWAVLPTDCCIDDGMILCDLTLDCVAAGVAFRLGDSVMDEALCVLLDSERKIVELTSFRSFPLIEQRSWPVEKKKAYRMRILLEGDVIYVYIDDELAIQCFEPGARLGAAALIVERGTVRWSSLAICPRKKDGKES